MSNNPPHINLEMTIKLFQSRFGILHSRVRKPSRLLSIYPRLDVPGYSLQGQIMQCSEKYKEIPPSITSQKLLASLNMVNLTYNHGKVLDSTIRRVMSNYFAPAQSSAAYGSGDASFNVHH